MLRKIELKKRSLLSLAAVMMVGTAGAVTINNHSFESTSANDYNGDSPAGECEVLWIELGASGRSGSGSNGYDNIRLDASTVDGADGQ